MSRALKKDATYAASAPFRTISSPKFWVVSCTPRRGPASPRRAVRQARGSVRLAPLERSIAVRSCQSTLGKTSVTRGSWTAPMHARSATARGAALVADGEVRRGRQDPGRAVRRCRSAASRALVLGGPPAAWSTGGSRPSAPASCVSCVAPNVFLSSRTSFSRAQEAPSIPSSGSTPRTSRA
jgi:hypothetical protein